MINVQEFMRQVPPKRPSSALTPFADDLFLLSGQGYTAAQLLDYLVRNEVKTTESALKAFMRRRKAAPAPARNSAPEPSRPGVNAQAA